MNEQMNDHPEEALSAYLDGALSEKEKVAVEEHLAACGECRALLEDLRLLDSGMEADEPPAVPGDLGRRIMAGLEEPAAAQEPRRSLWTVVRGSPLAAAASLAAVAILAIVWLSAPGSRQQPEPVAGDAVDATPELRREARPEEAPQPLEEPITDLADEVVAREKGAEAASKKRAAAPSEQLRNLGTIDPVTAGDEAGGMGRSLRDGDPEQSPHGSTALSSPAKEEAESTRMEKRAAPRPAASRAPMPPPPPVAGESDEEVALEDKDAARKPSSIGGVPAQGVPASEAGGVAFGVPGGAPGGASVRAQGVSRPADRGHVLTLAAPGYRIRLTADGDLSVLSGEYSCTISAREHEADSVFAMARTVATAVQADLEVEGNKKRAEDAPAWTLHMQGADAEFDMPEALSPQHALTLRGLTSVGEADSETSHRRVATTVGQSLLRLVRFTHREALERECGALPKALAEAGPGR